MKKIAAILSTVMLLVAVVLPINTFALAVSSSVSGPSTVRAGDTITVYFNIGASDIYPGKLGLSVVSGKINYDTSKLTYVSSSNAASGWQLNCDGTNFLTEDSDMTHPITSSRALFSMTFKVASSLATGTPISVSVIDVEATDAGAEAYTSATYSATIAAPVVTTAPPVKTTAPVKTTTPKTGNANLSSLEVKNVTLSPAFNPSVTKYTASVDFSVDKLDVIGATQDPSSTVSMGSKKLAVGTNTIKITVKAQGGAKKTYVLSITRAQDPNAPVTTETMAALNKDTKLSGITVDGFVLSPAFDPAVKKYIVWLPYETENLILSGLPATAKSTVTIEGGTNLVAGKANDIKIICTAEDGTKETYTITAMRAPANGVYGSVFTKPTISNNIKPIGASVWLTIVLCVVFLLVGFGVSYLIFIKKDKNNDNGPDDDYYDGDRKYLDKESEDNYNYNEYSSNNNSSKSYFRGISFPSSTPISYADDMDYEDEKPKVTEMYNVPQESAYVPQNQVAQAPVTPAPAAPAQAYVPPKAPAAPAQAYVPPQAPVTPAQAYVPPKVQDTPEKTYAPQYNQAPKDSESLGLPYTPAGAHQAYKADTVENPQPARKFPKNPFEMSADD